MKESDLHLFLDNNLPEYEHKDLLRILRFYLQHRGLSAKRPIRTTISHFADFSTFLCIDWQGVDIIPLDKCRKKKSPKKKPVQKEDEDHWVPETHGSCSCGGNFVIRTNRQKGNKFLGCTNYPRCRNTQNYP